MAHALPNYAAPLFCLDGTIYPVPTEFDWKNDRDVLLDACRETRWAVTNHRIARYTPDRQWLQCECIDPAEHEKYLVTGLFALTNTLLTLMPNAAHDPKHSHRIPFLAGTLRYFAMLVITVLSGGLLLETAI